MLKNPADLLEVCQTILKYQENGDPAKDVIEQTPYSTEELIHELALFYVTKNCEHEVTTSDGFTALVNADGRVLKVIAGPASTLPRKENT